jgi:hypothetical protein
MKRSNIRIVGKGMSSDSVPKDLGDMCGVCRQTTTRMMELNIEPSRLDYDVDECWQAYRKAGV